MCQVKNFRLFNLFHIESESAIFNPTEFQLIISHETPVNDFYDIIYSTMVNPLSHQLLAILCVDYHKRPPWLCRNTNALHNQTLILSEQFISLLISLCIGHNDTNNNVVLEIDT